MPTTPIVAVLTGSPDSFEAVRWAAWLSQHTALPLHVAHAYPGPPGSRSDEAHARDQAGHWLEDALESCAWTPFELHLTVAGGSLVELVDAQLRDGGILVSGSHSPAGMVSWASRVRRCPVVLVPEVPAATAPPHLGPEADERILT